MTVDEAERKLTKALQEFLQIPGTEGSRSVILAIHNLYLMRGVLDAKNALKTASQELSRFNGERGI